MRPLLRGAALQALVASSGAFAALTAQGVVITWGEAEAGGDSSAVQVPLGTGFLLMERRKRVMEFSVNALFMNVNICNCSVIPLT